MGFVKLLILTKLLDMNRKNNNIAKGMKLFRVFSNDFEPACGYLVSKKMASHTIR